MRGGLEFQQICRSFVVSPESLHSSYSWEQIVAFKQDHCRKRVILELLKSNKDAVEPLATGTCSASRSGRTRRTTSSFTVMI